MTMIHFQMKITRILLYNHEREKMRVILTILTGALLTVIALGCSNDAETQIEAKSMEQIHAENGVPVKTASIETGAFQTEYSYFAVLTGYTESSGNAMLSDEVESIKYKVGDYVKKDAVVVTFPIDNPQAQYYQSKVSYEHAEATLKRIKSLYDGGGISLQEYENTKTQYEVSKANWDTIQETVVVKAPVSGIITKMSVRVGDDVNPGDALFTVSTTKKLKSKIWVSESQIADIKVGNPATATWQGKTITGKVVQVDLSLNQDQQAFEVIAEFDNSGGEMLNGVNAEIILKGQEIPDIISIARKNLLNDGESDYVFVAEKGVAVKRPVNVGRSKGFEVEILDGLNIGETLIIEGLSLLNDNAKISVKN